MAYDDGQANVIQYTIPLLTAEQDKRNAELKKYSDALNHFGDLTDAKKAELATLTTQVDDYQKKLDNLISDGTTQLRAQVEHLDAQIDELLKVISDLNTQIDARRSEVASLQTKMSDLQNEGQGQLDDIQSQGVKLGRAQIVYDVQRDALQAAQVKLVADQDAFAKASADNQVKMDAQQASIDTQLAQLEQTKQEVKAMAQQQSELAAKLQAAQDDLAAKVASAQPILDQADALAQLDTQLSARRLALDTQEKQNKIDVNQIGVAKIALANAQSDLNIREAALRAAEQKVGG